MRPFGCSITILNTRDHLGKFDGNADEGFFVGYSTNSKAFRVFNSRTRIVEENLHVKFSKATPNIAESGPNLLFDLDAPTKSMNYEQLFSKDSHDVGFKPSEEVEKKDANNPENKDSESMDVMMIYSDDDEGVDAKADMTNLDTNIFVSNGEFNHKDFQNCMFACFLSQVEPKKVIQALQDLSWIEVMQEELLQFKLQHVWTLMDLPHGKRAIGTKWVYRNKKDERGNCIQND
ncbi:putative ribonuclease H-like domain-containing protein [Tanacetum coccineum]